MLCELIYARLDTLHLALQEVFAIFGITKSISTRHISCIVFYIDRQLFIIEQQLALLLNFFQYGFSFPQW